MDRRTAGLLARAGVLVLAAAACTVQGTSSSGGGTGVGATPTTTRATAPAAHRTVAEATAGLVDIVSVLGLRNAEAAGTGIVLTPDGTVLTNNHVISGSTSITATDLGNRRSYRAVVVGYDRSKDLAVLQLQGAAGLTALPLDARTRVAVGDPVTAIGNAGGRGGAPAVVQGRVTALDQQITASEQDSGSSERLSGLIAVDAPIRAGDSGGPLLSADGQVIGINTAASVGPRLTSARTEGFAVPAEQARSTSEAILAHRASTTVHLGATAWLGVLVADGSTPFGQAGAEVLEVLAGSPAERLGLGTGDVVTALQGAAVADATGLTGLLDLHHPGDRVSLSWTDNTGTAQQATLTLGAGPAG